MPEIEVKVLDVDIKKVKDTLLTKGANLVKRENQENYIYALPNKKMSENGYVRIRKVENLLDGSTQTILCVKKLISQEKIRKADEHEVEVSNLDECKNILHSMGLEFNGLKRKHRESYFLNNALIEIDTWDKDTFPEPYIEIEADSEETIFELLSYLSIPHEHATSKTLEEIKRERGII